MLGLFDRLGPRFAYNDPAALPVHRLNADGPDQRTRKCDIDASAQKQQFWAGMVALT
ncbi:MAG TPA: hypothetical protein VKT76_11275 [Bradyrhizobium sp.]|nr:hypothetical protein [Bradyrhizobium sp.]